MAVYDNRDEPAYAELATDLSYSDNAYILSWWTPAHDALLAKLIADRQWSWYWSSTDEVVEITPPDVLESWKSRDPLCSRYAWYNVLMYFSASRAERLGLTAAIRNPEWKTCLLCGQTFVEDSLPLPLIERLGIERLDFCAPCLRDTVLQRTGSTSTSKRAIIEYLRDLAELLERVPPQGFGEGVGDLRDLDTKDRVKLLRLLRAKPATQRVKAVFGSWLNALIQAGVLEDGTRRTSRGIQTIARDGHVCLSLGEKTIDDWLYSRGLQHEKEPRYPEGNFRGDWRVGGTLVEYFGLAGNPEYDDKTREKTRICKTHGVMLVAIFPKDLASQRRLDQKLSVLLSGG